METNIYSEGQILLFDKPLDWTSFDLVNKVRHMIRHNFKIKKIKVGHAGTLDPLATGLMIICTGNTTKQINQLTGLDKTYIATIELGATTPTYDLESEVADRFDFKHITRELLKETLKQFMGNISQVPPIFSAIKIKGQKAYDLARRGKDIELGARNITIHKIEILEFDLPTIKLLVHCSKGTYIRSLANDLGKALSSGGHLTGLIRTQIGEFKLENALDIEKFKRNLRPNETN